jgi:phosphatidylserine/phosphatidylglycerophosphate/cardiolipin synthase-like enzyme
MTLNPSQAAFNDNREYAAEVRRGAELTDLSRLFEADWSNVAEPTLSSNLVVSPQNARDRLTKLLRRANRDILATVEVYTDSGIRTVMKERLDEGARVRIVLADPRDVDQNADAARVLKSYGFEVRFLHSPVMHAKAIVVDGALAYVGSVNLTSTSLSQNREVGVIVDDAATVGPLRAQAEADWTAATPAP